MNKILNFILCIWNRKFNSLLIRLLAPFYKNKPLKDIIIFESHTNFDCNSGALYQYLINNGYNNKYKIVWRVREKRKFINLPYNVEIVYENNGPSLKKVLLYLNAKFFFADNTMLRKPRTYQTSVYCTHGGIAIKNVKGLLTVRKDVDYILSPSYNFDSIMCENYSVTFPNNKMLHSGFPANDVLFAQNSDELKKICNKCYSKIVLWLPTFRKKEGGREDSTGVYPFAIPLFQEMQQLILLNKFLKKLDIHLIIKLHPYQDIHNLNLPKTFSNITFIDKNYASKRNIDVYRLMSCADALISDYSSATYSYLMLNRPIGFVLSDFVEYKVGLIVKNPDEFLVGKKINTINEFNNFLLDIYNGNDNYTDVRTSLLKWLYKFIDGNSSKRIVEYLHL